MYNTRPVVVSLFSGCGGLDLGFVNAGFDVAFACDHNADAVRAYTHNLGHAAEQLDVTTSEFDSKLAELEACDVLLGGFPCQGFSKAGPKKFDDERNTLYTAMIKALTTLKPKLFVAENVDGIAQNFQGQFLAQIIADCTMAGYDVQYRTLDAAWFGVPQHRRRVFIIGVAKGVAAADVPSMIWPAITHTPVKRNGERDVHTNYPSYSENLMPPVSLGEALEKLEGSKGVPDHHTGPSWLEKCDRIMEAIGPGQKLCNARHDVTSVRTWDVPAAFGETTEEERAILEAIVRNRRHKIHGNIPNGNPLTLEVIQELLPFPVTKSRLDDLVSRKYLKKVAEKWDVAGAMFASGLYRRPLLDQLSPTVLTNFHNPRYFVHPTKNRPFTVREAATLQSFPESFEFAAAGVSAVEAYRLIGNAVPPVLATRVAESIMSLWNRIQVPEELQNVA